MEPFPQDIVGIDLGTTHSLIGVVDAGFPILLADEDNSRLTPSAVHFPRGGEPVIGAAALRLRSTDPLRTILSIKRLMGGRTGDPPQETGMPVVAGADGKWRVQAGEQPLLPEEVSALILRRLKHIAECRLERAVSRAVITVPAYFNDAQRQATRKAGELAGFTVERILNEPTAAALAYGLERLDEKSKIAVYDLGGGTFDLSILELNEGIFQVLATHGDTRLGGDDFDQLLLEMLMHEAFPNQSAPAGAAGRLWEAAVAAKHALSFAEETVIAIPFLDGGRHFERPLTRQEFERLIQPLLERTRRHCLQALADARLRAEEMDEIILVGGSTRIPLVREMVGQIFGREPNTAQHPDEAVALGAVIQGGMLSGAFRRMTLLDVTPLSLGIETFGGLMNVILPRNTTIPCKAGEMFTNAVDNQPSMLLRVLQGERELARDNWELGQFQIDFSPGPRGSARVGVQFSIDADGILQVLARDTATQTDKVLEIRSAAVAVDDARVEQMVSESVEHAFADMAARQRTEATLKAEELLKAIETALQQAGDLVSDGERQQIQCCAQSVQAALAGGGLAALKAANAALDAATEPLAAALMERALEDSLRRKGVL
ncbi:MAG: Hsp70 family protein [Verrucomicrobiales bacterium]|nr:Hsp70 family protein [Verrucomicrobiales bacterium]